MEPSQQCFSDTKWLSCNLFHGHHSSILPLVSHKLRAFWVYITNLLRPNRKWSILHRGGRFCCCNYTKVFRQLWKWKSIFLQFLRMRFSVSGFPLAPALAEQDFVRRVKFCRRDPQVRSIGNRLCLDPGPLLFYLQPLLPIKQLDKQTTHQWSQ